jgi:hypothetical protein
MFSEKECKPELILSEEVNNKPERLYRATVGVQRVNKRPSGETYKTVKPG